MKSLVNKVIFAPNVEYQPNGKTIKAMYVITAKIVEELDNEVRCIAISPNQVSHVFSIPKNRICYTEEAAEKVIFSLTTELRTKKIRETIPSDIVPEYIRGHQSIFSGNPLRFGEPLVGYAAQANTFGDIENAQKVIQTMAAIDEDILSIYSLLDLASVTNNYTKKILGKYIIIELISQNDQFKKLADLNTEYKTKYFSKFKKELKVLEKKYSFLNIRNKIGAHRDTNVSLIYSIESWRRITRFNITQYIELFHKHMDVFLTDLYPIEKRMYFLMRNKPIYGGTIATPGEEEYELFDAKVISQ